MRFGLRAWIRDLKYKWENFWTSGLDFRLERLEFGFRNSEFILIGSLFWKYILLVFVFTFIWIWILSDYILLDLDF